MRRRREERRSPAGRSLAPVSTRRLCCLAAGALVGCAGIFAQAVRLQAFEAPRLADLAMRQHHASVELGARRGEIVDRHGRLLAGSARVQSVAAYPRFVAQPGVVAARLAPLLGRPASQLRRSLERGGRSFVWLDRWVTPLEAERVRGLGFQGIELVEERRRLYPGRGLAASYLGFAGLDDVGLHGMELAFDRALRGEAATLAAVRTGGGSTVVRDGAASGARAGSRLVLALDLNLQHVAERALAAAVRRHRAVAASLVAMDPETGDVLAAAQAPGFDPNFFRRENPNHFRARAFVDPFEPGSTLKPFVVALALDGGVLEAHERFDCEGGRWRVKDRWIRDHEPFDVLSVSDVLRLSSNICAAKIADRLGSRRLVEGLQRLGFGQRTSAFPGEAAGWLRPIREPQAVERANLAFGQGLSVTAIQLASAATALANGGRRVAPRLALRLEQGEEVQRFAPAPPKRVLSAETTAIVMQMLRAAVDDGTARAAGLPHHAVAGKTGTAQKVHDGHYSWRHYVASFLGIVPADRPRLVIVVVVDEPRGVHTGGSVAAPVFREVAQYAVERLGWSSGGAE